MIVWDGVNSDDLKIRVERSPGVSRPPRKYSVMSIPGRNGDLLIAQNAWENYDQSYDVWAMGQKCTGDAAKLGAALAAWFYGPRGYARLEDSYDPETYRMAAALDALELDSVLGKAVKGTITFRCKPQRWLKSGERKMTITESQQIYNPTSFRARPLLRIYGQGDVGIGSGTITIRTADGYTDIDCDAEEAYKDTAVNNCNGNIVLTGGNFPELGPGPNRITLGQGITGLEIIPRWWTL